jgi:hypothetical protein
MKYNFDEEIKGGFIMKKLLTSIVVFISIITISNKGSQHISYQG